MKVVIALAALSVLCLAQAAPSTTAPKAGGGAGVMCKHTNDCGEGFCCVTHFLGKRKRFIFDSISSGGKCEPERRENDHCHVFMGHDIFNPEMYDDYCPCMAGLECRGETVDESGHTVVHHNPKCQPMKTSSGN